jgi:hypothetical protein
MTAIAVAVMSFGLFATDRKNSAIAIAIIGVLLAAFEFGSTWYQYKKYSDALRYGRVRAVEGHVVRFFPDDASGHTPETFYVGGMRFSISPAAVSAAFGNTVSKGGPDLSNACARILYIDDMNERRIVWLGLKRRDCPEN